MDHAYVLEQLQRTLDVWADHAYDMDRRARERPTPLLLAERDAAQRGLEAASDMLDAARSLLGDALAEHPMFHVKHR